jgi:hypothetical protein
LDLDSAKLEVFVINSDHNKAINLSKISQEIFEKNTEKHYEEMMRYD